MSTIKKVQNSSAVHVQGIIGAAMVTIMLLAQLYSYEDFSSVLMIILPVTDMPLVTSLAAALILFELLSLPFFLQMKASQLFLGLSGTIAFAAAVFWLIAALTNSRALNSGIFSTALELPGGILAAGWSTILFALTILTLVRLRQRTGKPGHLEPSQDV